MESNGDAPNNDFGRVGNVVFWGMLGFGLLGPLLCLYLAQSTASTARQDCIENGGPRSKFEGVIRRAGNAMYAQGTTWRKITGACSGKNEGNCLRQDHGPAVLAANIGKPVTVEFCGNEVASYTVAGRRFQPWP